MNKLELTYIGLDSWSRPVYEDIDGKLFVDVDNRKNRDPEICTKYNNQFEGEPDTPIQYIEKYKGVEIVFFPKRITR